MIGGRKTVGKLVSGLPASSGLLTLNAMILPVVYWLLAEPFGKAVFALLRNIIVSPKTRYSKNQE